MKSHNLDKLGTNELRAIAWMFQNMYVGWTFCYMIEVQLDRPFFHLCEGGSGIKTHGGNGSRDYASHYGDTDWAVIHKDDEDWIALNIVPFEDDEIMKLLDSVS